MTRAAASSLLVLAFGCQPDAGGESWTWTLPDGQPAPLVPEDNPMAANTVELGRHLFYDPRLSGNGTQSCASCHEQARAFSDGLATPRGSTGESVPRNAMGLTNVAYRPHFGWSNPALTRLEDHALVPLFGEFPVELGLTGVEDVVFERLAAEPRYAALFDGEPISVQSIVSALAAFQRTLLSYDSPYDRWLAGDDTAMSDVASRGHDLFFSERTECYHCHGGFDFTNAVRSTQNPEGVPAFHNTGLYDVDGRGAYPPPNVGLIEFTGEPQDMGRFRVPTLRNVAVTAPFMHDGSIETLRGVIAHYAEGGRAHGSLTDALMRPLQLDDRDIDDLVAFLDALTDPEFLSDPALADPW